ncbi:hypothetical protein F5146DRAFT_968740, partial [Armillaria mellea]
MSFYDGVSIASLFDGVGMCDIVKLLQDHDIFVGQSIRNEREYLYYFIGNCNVEQQTAIRNDGTWRFHHVEQLCVKLSISLLVFILKIHHPDITIMTLHSRRQLLRELNNYDLEALVRDRGWNTDDPTFVDGTSVAATLRTHHKDVLLDALRFVYPPGFISSELLRETRMTIYMFCSLLHGDALGKFHQYLQRKLQPPTFSDGIYVHEEYNLVTTPVLQWLCHEYHKDIALPSPLTCIECFHYLQLAQMESIRWLIRTRHVASKNPIFVDNTPVIDVLRGLPLCRAWDILASLYDVPTEMRHRRECFVQFCAVLPANIAQTFVETIKKEYNNLMPPKPSILSALIGVTFVQPNNKPQYPFPKELHVRRQVVLNALLWLKENNPLWADVYIDCHRLQELPEDAVPNEIVDVTRVCHEMEVLAEEDTGYVPESMDDDDITFEDLYPNVNGVNLTGNDATSEYTEGDISSENITLHANGMINANGNEILDEDLRGHALTNEASPPNLSNTAEEKFRVKWDSRFVSEYARASEDGLRTDGGPRNPNHLLGAFPILFPYGLGGFETARKVDVPYEIYARWTMLYADRRFRKDLHFVFQVFGVILKRNICRSAVLRMRTNSYQRHQPLIASVRPKDLLNAAVQESQKTPFTNPGVQALKSELVSVRSKVLGTDESRRTLRSKIWSTTVVFNPPNLWITINPNDTHDPIAQVLAGEGIDLDNFMARCGPTASICAKTIANDPFASAKFFHMIVKIVLESLFGITVDKHRGQHSLCREEGIFGIVQAYIGTIE